MSVFAEVERTSHQILDTIKPSTRLMNQVLLAYSALPLPDYFGARQTFFTYLETGVNPDRWSYGHLGGAAARRGMVKELKSLVRERAWIGIQPDTQMYTSLIHAHSRRRHTRGMLRAIHECQAQGLIPSSNMWLELVRGLARCDQLTTALESVERLGKGTGPEAWKYILALSRSYSRPDLEARVLRRMTQYGWDIPESIRIGDKREGSLNALVWMARERRAILD
ncbi:hypothetical protein BJ684DRAFT_15727 [Piptocephalis cylindrospora]|uniref:Pentacotripeptide-repeat region of PRORP domain-containing protein n=1 Tax=Piptocephalis cylindrospora TaxID=1907219 RepID=A0A4P9Y4L6_9FUNG|nr:hypothetical protein BJ684DRAFT_15727 [Piptocephalis cylindrospora]|eukprot:RKP13916.1 hypothetical protein BJ684DRAFT_15727 [Piptocephalis cylindrospora]